MTFTNVISFTMAEVKAGAQRSCDLISPECVVVISWAREHKSVGYTGGSSILLVCLLATFGLWYRSSGSISVDNVNSPKAEMFYWAAITFSQTLGTALGDWMADSTGLGYEGGAGVRRRIGDCHGGLLLDQCIQGNAVLGGLFFLTRPLGATVGDLLDKPRADGGLALRRPLASVVIAIFILACLLVLPQRAGSHPGETAGA
jgi:uncharacterized membrane-anchored protein